MKLPASAMARVDTLARLDEGRGAVHIAALALVWVTIAASGIVFSEPAPVDILAISLVVLLPAVGVVAISPSLTAYLSLWLVIGACTLLATTTATDIGRALAHNGVSIYLYVSSFVIAAFVARRPVEHTKLIFNAYLVAALAAAMAGIAGYLDLVPGAFDLFTKFGRASGTFKDPNVFGPFLVPAFLYALHLALERPVRWAMAPLAASALLALAVLLSFSRGAWLNLAVALAAYGYFAFITGASRTQRLKIASLVVAGGVLVIAVSVIAMQFDAVSDLLTERAQLTQSYDEGPEGRFGGQEKALGLILEHPLGIGAQEFAAVYHHEEAHNVYLSMVLNAGWLGGGVYWIMVGVTLALGFLHTLKATPTRPLFLIAYAAFIANALEGAIVDTDHWRHFYLLMAIVWGLMAADKRSGSTRPPRRLVPVH